MFVFEYFFCIFTNKFFEVLWLEEKLFFYKTLHIKTFVQIKFRSGTDRWAHRAVLHNRLQNLKRRCWSAKSSICKVSACIFFLLKPINL